MDYGNARNAKNGSNVKKNQLSEDLNYKTKQKNYKLHLFSLENIYKAFIKAR